MDRRKREGRGGGPARKQGAVRVGWGEGGCGVQSVRADPRTVTTHAPPNPTTGPMDTAPTPGTHLGVRRKGVQNRLHEGTALVLGPLLGTQPRPGPVVAGERGAMRRERGHVRAEGGKAPRPGPRPCLLLHFVQGGGHSSRPAHEVGQRAPYAVVVGRKKGLAIAVGRGKENTKRRAQWGKSRGAV